MIFHKSLDSVSSTQQIHAEQLKVVYRNLPPLLISNVLVGGALVYGLWGVAPSTRLVLWTGVMMLVLALRGALYVCYRLWVSEPAHWYWAAAFIIGSGAAGASWGAAGLFLFPTEAFEYQLFILFVLMGMGVGAITSLAVYLPAFYAFLPLSLLPVGILMLRADDHLHVALGVMSFAYVVSLSFFARTINKALSRSLSLQFENVDLVERLSEQRDESERANVAKSKFLAAASHDLRQPLHSLILFTTALNERIKYPEVSRIVSNINDSVRALERLFNALLDVSRLDAGVLQPELRHFRLPELCHRLASDYVPEAKAKGLQLECVPCETTVYSDPALLERVLRNYLSNAVRYTDQGTVRIACVPGPDQVRIEIRDTGIGIPLVQQREIFNEFYQLGNPERDRTKGLGLGLAIVDRVARLLGYPIDVQSTPGQGSCFSITVPLGDAQHIVAEAATQTDTVMGELAGMRVMVVDDEISVREGMRALLDQWRCEVTLVGSEDEAVAVTHTTGVMPDALIVDYRLREGKTGVQAIERLQHELGFKIPALIVTGDTAVERLRVAQASGYQLVHKPVQPAMLCAFLRNVRHQQTTS